MRYERGRKSDDVLVNTVETIDGDWPMFTDAELVMKGYEGLVHDH